MRKSKAKAMVATMYSAGLRVDDGNRIKTMRLATSEFIRRFLLHVLPEGFRRIRYYGFLAVRARATRLTRCRELFRLKEPKKKGSRTCVDIVKEPAGFDPLRCPACKLGTLVRVCLVPRCSPERAVT